MKRVTRLQLAALWLCILWLVVVVAPLVPQWMWSGLHPSSWSQEQLDTVMVPVRRLRELNDRFRAERNGYLFTLGPAILALLIIAWRISVKPDINEEPPTKTKSAPDAVGPDGNG